MSWKADQLQCVLFTVPSAPQIDAAEAWSIIAEGRSPDAYQRPSISPLAGSYAHGLTDGLRLTVQSQPGRVDIFLTAEPSLDPSAPPRIEHVERAAATLNNAARKCLMTTKVVRVALVANLSKLASSHEEAASILADATGTWFPSPPLDCLYQVNVRCAFTSTPQIEMNRVLTFSAGSYQIMNSQIASMLMMGVPQVQAQIPLIAFKLDLNSATTTDISDYALSMFVDLNAELSRIMEGGLGAIK